MESLPLFAYKQHKPTKQIVYIPNFRMLLKNINTHRKIAKANNDEPEENEKPEVTRPRRRKGANKAQSSNPTPVKTPARRVRQKAGS